MPAERMYERRHQRFEPYVDKTNFPRKNHYVLLFLQHEGNKPEGNSLIPPMNVPTGRMEEFDSRDALKRFAKENGLKPTEEIYVEEMDWKNSGNSRVFIHTHWQFVDAQGKPLQPSIEGTESLPLEA